MQNAVFRTFCALILAWFLSSFVPVNAQVLEQDSLALVAIYNATDGSNWRSDPQWLDRPVPDWGFLAVEGDRVVGLGLAQLELKGTIPPEIGNLTALQSLSLELNQLSGPIPDEIGNLTELEYLSLYRNQLSGPVPASIGNLTGLTDLIIWGNQLTFLPEEIGNLVGLTQLVAWENKITNIPERIGDLVNVTKIMMSSNEIITPIPATIGNLTNLQTLDLSWNPDLPGPIPSTVGNLSSLQSLFIYDTSLDGPIPPELGNLVSIEQIDLSHNQLEGSIPASVGNLQMVWDMNLSNNNLTGPIPREMGQMTALEGIYLQENQLTGSIPAELGSLDKVRIIQLMGNELTGATPASLASMPIMNYLDIRDNDIEDLADFTNAPGTNFRMFISGNRLHFDDLQLNASVNMGDYWPQQEIDVQATDMGNEWVLACGVGGTGNSYQWFFEDRTGASNNSLQSTFVVPKPVNNRYYCEAKNGQFVDLILTTWLWPQASGGGNEAPTAVFSASTTSGSAPLTVAFDASASSDPEAGSLTFAWSFGDGAVGSGVTTSHMYTTAGSFTATLTVTDPEGATATATTDIEVQAAGTSDFGYLTGLWLYDDETGYDESAHGHNGELLGSPEVRSDPDNTDVQQLYFDGSSLVRIPDSPDFTTPEMTVGLWVRLDDLSGIHGIAGHTVTASANNAGWFMLVGGEEIGVLMVTDSGDVILSSDDAGLVPGVFHAIAFTVGGGQATLYVDGEVVDSKDAGAVLDPDNPLYLGGTEASVLTSGGGLRGFLHGFWIDDRAYTQEEIRDAQGIDDDPELPDDLLTWYPFNGTLDEMVTGEETQGGEWTDDPTGTANNALFIPETWSMYSDNYTFSDTPADGISFGGWFRFEAGQDLARFVQLGSESSQSGFAMWGPDPSIGQGFEIAVHGQNGTTWIDARTGLTVESGQWFHLFSTHDGTHHRVFVNGMLVLTGGETAIGPFVARKEGEHIRFGGYQAASYSDFRVYNRALSESEVLDLAFASRELTEVSTTDRSLGGGVFTTQQGGFVFGTNGYGDLAKAELLSLPSGRAEGTLSGVRVWMGHSWDPGPVLHPGDAYVRIWSGTASAGPQDLLYESPAVTLTTNEKEFAFENPAVVGAIPIFLVLPDVQVPTNFFVAVHFEPYGNDVEKYAIMSGPQVGAPVPTVWEQWSDDTWSSVSDAWFGGGDGAHMWIDAVEAVDAQGVAVEEPEEVSLPSGVELLPAYPNPFNPITTIEYDVPSRVPVRISVMDMLGREVAILVDDLVESGRHHVRFDASGFASGVYMVRMQASASVMTQSIVLLK